MHDFIINENDLIDSARFTKFVINSAFKTKIVSKKFKGALQNIGLVGFIKFVLYPILSIFQNAMVLN